MTELPFGVYLHFPFCRSRCPYCAFYSVVGREELWPSYVAALEREIAYRAGDPHFAGRPVSSIYFGGGTPSLLDPETIGRLVTRVTDAFAGDSDLEVTLEANPESVDLERLQRVRTAGVNRLSLGWQSLRDHRLEVLGRIHQRRDNLRAYSEAREAGFTNVGVDLIFGVPGQSAAEWAEELSEVAGLGPEHVSAYEITVEEGTRFARARERGTWAPPGEQERIEMFESIPERLAPAGIHRYEISNYSLPRRECRHNLAGWRGGDVLGCGASAASHIENVRWLNVADVAAYIRRLDAGDRVAEPSEVLAEHTWAAEDLYLGLRLTEGIAADARLAPVPEPERSRLGLVLAGAERAGLVMTVGEIVKLTPRGVLLADTVFEELLAR